MPIHPQRTALAICGTFLAFPLAALSVDVDFNRDIRPILSQNCFACHGPDAGQRKAKLRLDTQEGSRNVIVPEKPEESELVARILSDDPDERMPPPETEKALKPAERDLLRQWVREGAGYSQAWTYVAPKRHPVPEVRDKSWLRNWIDNFVLARLEEEGLKPSPAADRTTMIRRYHFDLTGLPPSKLPLWKGDQGRYDEGLANELLASDHFGERMAMYWLDLVRFADTVGYHGDQDHSISPYRDYVIDAFNDNMPFDQFTREQLAGDLVPDSGIDQKIATGYNRLLQTSHEGGVQAKEYNAIYAADRVRNVSAVWMGGTLGCAQCHDHKFDPYLTKDFYAMAAFFADIDDEAHLKSGTNSLPTKRAPEISVLSRRERARVAEIEAKLAKPAEVKERKALESEQEGILKNKRPTMITVAKKEPRVTRVLPRGNWLDDSGPVVQPAVPVFLGKLDVPGERERATRHDLANWLTDPEKGVGGLTARVFVNRLWYLFFGSGISRSLDDFGGQGVPPANPELLDNLAVEFHESGWDVKHMVRLLVTSRAYQQSSLAPPDLLERDPDNQLVARQSRYRLPAEMVRDNALAISGLLDESYGGGSSKPYQPAGYYRHLNFPQRKYAHHDDTRQWRRGVYVHWQRQFLHPMLKAFDAPTREECTAQRPRSNTPTAAMVMLNDPTFVEAARVFGERIMREGGTSPDQRIIYAFEKALTRKANRREIVLMRTLGQKSHGEFRSKPDEARKLIATGQAPVPDDLDPAELASWTMIARAVLNLSETNTRN